MAWASKEMQYSNQDYLVRSGGAQQDFSSFSSSTYSAEEHIYEEIAEVESDSEDTTADIDTDTEDDSFFTLISSGRRNNLRYYGDTSWD